MAESEIYLAAEKNIFLYKCLILQSQKNLCKALYKHYFCANEKLQEKKDELPNFTGYCPKHDRQNSSRVHKIKLAKE